MSDLEGQPEGGAADQDREAGLQEKAAGSVWDKECARC